WLKLALKYFYGIFFEVYLLTFLKIYDSVLKRLGGLRFTRSVEAHKGAFLTWLHLKQLRGLHYVVR
ncbi:MAG: hypothetical protein NTX00_00450, partial [Candidatus Parcubacteria bacterium]|nr:hypothetical protein [Candidatus Parcubacteria bacterium]